jgi:hypothetical protein
MKTHILSKLGGVHLSQSQRIYFLNKNIEIKIVSVHHGFINNLFLREIEKHSMY